MLTVLGFPLFVLAKVVHLVLAGPPEPPGISDALLVGLWLTLFVAGLLAMLAMGARRRGLTDRALWIVLAPVCYLRVSAAA
ncbi:MAG: hypothetical protein NTZ14_14715 [Hyphomicrobiales bacterium]|nr:hypothetical protein [Hyphomicrobiales bacterium]